MTGQNSFQVAEFILRANYPNLYARFAAAKDTMDKLALPGYRAGQVEYRLEGATRWEGLPVRGVDIPLLNDHDTARGLQYLSLLIRTRAGDDVARREVTAIVDKAQAETDRFCQGLSLVETPFVVPSFTTGHYRREEVSHKGYNLVKLSQQGYPVPDFCILTTRSFQAASEERTVHLAQGLQNLEQMTRRKVGSASHPLVFALRYAMPSYIPGLMPTFLNVGVTEENFPTLCTIYGRQAGRKMFFNNLKNLRTLLDEEGHPLDDATRTLLDSPTDLQAAIDRLTDEIRDLDPDLLSNPVHQVEFMDRCARKFCTGNQDLIFTLSHGRSVSPALVMQQMICTVRGEGSYPGVLYSRNPNTGRHFSVETVRSIFGEDIMTGTVQAEVTEFADRAEIKAEFPALYHFVPCLPVLEKEFAATVTAEFASESVRSGHFFALLQLNDSEMTGRAALVSAMDMYHEGLLPKQKVPSLVRPFHFRQIMSDTIDEEAFDSLEFFADGYSILPRSAISARVYFSRSRAQAARNRGEMNICLCRQSFTPSDAAIIDRMDVILSLTPAAIHLVTTCRGSGTLAFLDLESYGVRLDGPDRMVNSAGLEIREGDWITLSSRRKKVYKGQARFTPARFHKYRQGEKLDLNPREREVFRTLESAFTQYEALTHSLKAVQVETYSDLVKLVQSDLQDEPERAAEIVNLWYDLFTDKYVTAILGSDLGTHNKQAAVFGHLTLARRVGFFHQAVAHCRADGLSGLTAGSFMLGRFIQVSHGVSFWNQLSDDEIGWLLNEWVAYRTYRDVLAEVGETRIVRARKMLLEEPNRPVRISAVDVKAFILLKLSSKTLGDIDRGLAADSRVETREILKRLQMPYGDLFDFGKPWSLNPLRKICADEGLPLPAPDEV